jgi:hypothetical protein
VSQPATSPPAERKPATDLSLSHSTPTLRAHASLTSPRQTTKMPEANQRALRFSRMMTTLPFREGLRGTSFIAVHLRLEICRSGAPNKVITLTRAVLGMAGASQGITAAPVWLWLAPVKVQRRRRSVAHAILSACDIDQARQFSCFSAARSSWSTWRTRTRGSYSSPGTGSVSMGR